MTRICRVCNAKAFSSHFGADSCRACAAFFKRTVLLESTLICRQNTNTCDVSTDKKFTCRRCRFVKCLDVGLNPKRIPTGPNLRIPDDDWLPKPESDTETSQLGTGSSGTSLLDVITEQYRLLEQTATRNDECVMRASMSARLSHSPVPLPATIGRQHQCIRTSNPLVIDFATQCFPEIVGLNDDEKWLVLKNFMTSRFIFDGVNRAQKAFPGNDQMFMVTFHTYVDINNLDYYLVDINPIYDKQHAVRMMQDMTRECCCAKLGPLLTRAALDEVETSAIYGLLCWPSYLRNATARVREICNSNHLRIFQELHHHYKKIGRTEYSSSLANISSILLCVQSAKQRLKEDMQIYRMLDVYKGNELEFNVVI